MSRDRDWQAAGWVNRSRLTDKLLSNYLTRISRHEGGTRTNARDPSSFNSRHFDVRNAQFLLTAVVISGVLGFIVRGAITALLGLESVGRRFESRIRLAARNTEPKGLF